MPPIADTDFPLIWFALTKNLETLPAGMLPAEMKVTRSPEIRNLTLSKGVEPYQDSIAQIKHQIEKGNTYQVNFTMSYKGDFRGSSRALYKQLRSKQRVNYAAYLETQDWAILSLSPELFFRKEGWNIQMRPMKGTAPRGRTLEEEKFNANALQESEKERSENLMILDLLRNDLGKICETGSIHVENPMEVERYETLLQMTSTITGRLRQETTVTDLFRATFPSGSVTGAPKIRTMQIIHELEQSPRRIYTGSIGFISSDTSVFNVAIRTASINFKKSTIEMGVGSGILYEADPVREYQECELKAKFLTDPPQTFKLLETILWKPENRYCMLNLHLDRLIKSADYFLFPISTDFVESILKAQEVEFLKIGKSQRVRILLDEQGRIEINAEPLMPLGDSKIRIRFSSRATNSTDRFLFHKTTNRGLYDQELEVARSQGYFDVLFRNERGEITEGAITNIFAEKKGVYYTPPLSCGVLSGTYRRYLLETKPFPIQERILYEEDLKNADAIHLTNAIRGLLRAFLEV
jgi:para-aminobenzoate synthetase / 4-amino-4-deoxychorismate lyase